MRKEIILCGVGGQGTILASRLIASAAMNRDLPILTAETIGMAQRGGSVFSHIRIGEGAGSPLIPKGKADLIIGFEPGEAVRQLPFLKPDGTIVVNKRPVMPVSASLGQSAYNPQAMLDYLRQNVRHVILVDGDKATAALGSSKVLNVVLLGAALESGALGFSEEDLQKVLQERVPERFLELNRKALSWMRNR
ncbi:MAG: indolepyruvate oxidoreductase subunit beta [Blautia sp.]|nr:indolepyruvate oxidoreductase subunit beta [Blautia sp.]